MIEVQTYTLALSTPYRWSKGTQDKRLGLILRLQRGTITGWGEVALPPHVDYPVNAFAAECRSLMAGLDPFAEDFLQEISMRECPARLRCGISTAVLSLRAAEQGLSLAAYLLGPGVPVAARVPVNELITDADPERCAELAQRALALGQDTIKVKCTTARALDLQRVAAIRAAAPNTHIRIDPNESWPLAWAADQLNAMAHFNIAYCEEPLPRDTPLAEYATLRRQTTVPIALDDSIRSVRDVQLVALLHAADALVIKAQRVGGPDRLLEIVRAASSLGLPCTVTSSLETALGLYLGVHCTAMTPQPIAAAGIGTAHFFAENVGEPPPIHDGHMAVPTGVGLGFDPQAWWDRP